MDDPVSSPSLRFDAVADAAYLRLYPTQPGESARRLVIAAPDGSAELVVDVAADGRVLGIEFLDPRRQLRGLVEND